MNKQLLFNVIGEIIDKGGYVRVHLTQYDRSVNKVPAKKITESEAFSLAKQFQEAICSDYINKSKDESLSELSSYDVESERIVGTFTFHNSLIEDVDLSGSEEPLPFADLDEIMKEDMRSEEYVSSFDLHKGEGL